MKKIFSTFLLLSTIGVSGVLAQGGLVMNTVLTPEQKLAGLSTVWSEAKYNYAFFDKIGEQKWDSLYRAFIRPVMESPNDYEYSRLLQRFCAHLRDGHTEIFYNKAPIVTTFFDKFQWYLSNVEGKAVVTSISSKQKEEIPIGSEIIEVNGMPTAEYLQKEVLPYISASTDHVRMNNAITGMFRSLIDQSYRVKIVTPAGKILDLDIAHKVLPEVKADPMYPAMPKRERVAMKWYPGDVAYVELNTFADQKVVEQFKAFLPELKKAKKLIIDLRNNGGGNTRFAAEILSCLTSDSLLIGSTWSTRVHSPAYMSWGVNYAAKDTVDNPFAKKAYEVYHREYFEHGNTYKMAVPKDQERVVVPTVLLIGNNTFSAAEDFLILADKQKHMTKIGQLSNGSTGNPIFFELGGDVYFRVCSKKDTYPDGREFVGYGVKPDIEVVPTLEDFRKGYDRTLEEALKFLKKAK